MKEGNKVRGVAKALLTVQFMSGIGIFKHVCGNVSNYCGSVDICSFA